MASDGQSVQIPATSLVHGSQAPTTVKIQQGGKTVPLSGNGSAAAATSASNQSASAAVVAASAAVTAAKTSAAALAAAASAAAKSAAQAKTQVPAQVAVLNKYLNDSGRPAQFRASEDEKDIQEINPATGEVIAEYSAAEFAELARSVGISGALVNERV